MVRFFFFSLFSSLSPTRPLSFHSCHTHTHTHTRTLSLFLALSLASFHVFLLLPFRCSQHFSSRPSGLLLQLLFSELRLLLLIKQERRAVMWPDVPRLPCTTQCGACVGRTGQCLPRPLGPAVTLSLPHRGGVLAVRSPRPQEGFKGGGGLVGAVCCEKNTPVADFSHCCRVRSYCKSHSVHHIITDACYCTEEEYGFSIEIINVFTHSTTPLVLLTSIAMYRSWPLSVFYHHVIKSAKCKRTKTANMQTQNFFIFELESG